MLTLYHGSQVSVPQPDAKAGRKNLDFGPHQLCILNQTVIDKYLTFVESTVLDSEEDEP